MRHTCKLSAIGRLIQTKNLAYSSRSLYMSYVGMHLKRLLHGASGTAPSSERRCTDCISVLSSRLLSGGDGLHIRVVESRESPLGESTTQRLIHVLADGAARQKEPHQWLYTGDLRAAHARCAEAGRPAPQQLWDGPNSVVCPRTANHF